jgi:glutathione synthase/RimK-type ligase-like ATP-grasp enzyme
VSSPPWGVAVLVPRLAPSGAAGGPADRPVGRAALALEAEGVPVVFADRVVAGRAWGLRASPGGWRAVSDQAVAAAYDRFPAELRPTEHEALLAGVGDLPVANAPEVAALCRDKLAAQRVLEAHGVAIPEVEADPARFAERLAAWGRGFLKPRYGALGRDVRCVVPGDPLPARLAGTVPGTTEPAVLQRAVPPPAGWAGVCCRVLVQRRPDDGELVAVTPVVRRSRVDPVVNAARGAEVLALADASPGWEEAVAGAALAAARALAEPAGPVVELGVDVVVDPDGAAWVIEVNGRPRGRLEALVALDAARWSAAHLEACARPLRWLARRFAS